MSDWEDIPITDEEWQDAGRQWSDVPGEALRNVPTDAWNITKGIGQMIAHPIDTLGAASDFVLGIPKAVWEKTSETLAGKEPVVATVLRDIITPSLPGDPAGAQEAARSYLTEEGLKETLATRPVGSAIDLATALYGGAGGVARLAGTKAPRVAAAAQGLQRALTAPVRAVTTPIKKGAQAVGRKLYQSSMKWPEGMGFEGRDAAVQAGVERGLVPNRAGYEKLLKVKKELIGKQTALLDDAARQGKNIPMDDLYKGLDDLKNKMSMYPETDLRAIDKLIQEHDMAAARRGRNYLTPQEAQALKTAIYDRVSYDVLKTDYGTNQMGKVFGRNVKEGLEGVAPGIGEVNAELAPLMALEDPLYKTAFQGQMFSDRPIIGSSMGRVVAGTPGAVASWFTSPAWRAQQGVRLFGAGQPGSLFDILTQPQTVVPAQYVSRAAEKPKKKKK